MSQDPLFKWRDGQYLDKTTTVILDRNYFRKGSIKYQCC